MDPLALAPLEASTDISTKMVESAARYAEASVASSTRRIYSTAWKQFVAWCSRQQLVALPASAEAVALYISMRADCGRKVSTITRDLSAIAAAHRLAHLEPPTTAAPVRVVLKGIRREVGVAHKGKAPLSVAELRRMVRALGDSERDRRDHALLLVGFSGGFRRTELAGIHVEHMDFVPEGVTVLLPRSKTDQEGRGRRVALPFGSDPLTCPTRVLRAWMGHADIKIGPVFPTITRGGAITDQAMSSRGVARAVQRAAQRVGLDPDRFGGHSLRSGFCTAAARGGASERAIMRTTGHRSVMTVRSYIRDADLWHENAAAKLGL